MRQTLRIVVTDCQEVENTINNTTLIHGERETEDSSYTIKPIYMRLTAAAVCLTLTTAAAVDAFCFVAHHHHKTITTTTTATTTRRRRREKDDPRRIILFPAAVTAARTASAAPTFTTASTAALMTMTSNDDEDGDCGCVATTTTTYSGKPSEKVRTQGKDPREAMEGCFVYNLKGEKTSMKEILNNTPVANKDASLVVFLRSLG